MMLYKKQLRVYMSYDMGQGFRTEVRPLSDWVDEIQLDPQEMIEKAKKEGFEYWAFNVEERFVYVGEIKV